MKFKMQDKQNQLIERISDKHLVVGVDIAQQLHVARAVNFRGIVVGDPLAFENNEDGFASLLKWMDKLQRLNKLEQPSWEWNLQAITGLIFQNGYLNKELR
ncbi:IS110 family transposase [Brevibacterium sp. PAMC21349]|nr:IS110 family transposase [Brevibacterium sp. PAMC21349]